MEEVKKQKTKTSKKQKYKKKYNKKNVLEWDANNYLTHSKSSSGITLIALVVTIIVLLILAGVSINMVLGTNGIFSKAQDSKYTMEKAVLIDKIETLIVNWKADEIIDNSVTEERFWDDLKNAKIIDAANEVGAPVSTETVDGVKKEIYEIETTDGYIVDIIVTTKPDGEINISIGDVELSTSTAPKIYISLEADETSITVNATVRRLNDGKITYLYREQGTTDWIEIKKDTTDLTATVTGLTSGKTYEFKASVTNSEGSDEKISNPIKLVALVTSITLNKTSEAIAEGTTIQLTATISPENATNKELEWTSSNPSVSTVDENGLVTAIVEGSTTITATAKDGSGVKAECSITVRKPTISDYTWTQNKTEVIGTLKNGNGQTIKYEVGEDYNYTVTGVTDGYTEGWGILGAGAEGTEEAGKLLIMTTSDVGTLELKGKAGYNTGISQLDALSAEKCGKGARSINVDDINRVTGYDPENQGDGTVFGAEGWYEYGNVVTYTSSGATASNGNTNTSGLNKSVYYHPDGRQIGGTGGTQVSSIQETSTAYYYYPYSLTTSNAVDGTCKGISTGSKAYEMIFGTYANTSNGTGNQYWLASSCVITNSNNSWFYMDYMTAFGKVDYYHMCWSVTTSDFVTSMAVRSVVSL